MGEREDERRASTETGRKSNTRSWKAVSFSLSLHFYKASKRTLKKEVSSFFSQ